MTEVMTVDMREVLTESQIVTVLAVAGLTGKTPEKVFNELIRRGLEYARDMEEESNEND